MPGETVQPLLVASFLTMTVCFLLAGIMLGAAVAFGIMGLVIGWWMWSRPEIDEPAP
jgi:cytochrome c biogenesis factor